jgi:photosystem II stability/assembly factor-like uncharacterized protein
MGPGAREQYVVFLTRRTGFLLASDGIERTTDGGHSWRLVWRRAGVGLDWIGRDGASVVASGSIGTRDASAAAPVPMLVRSADRGARWLVWRPSLPEPRSLRERGSSLGWDWDELVLRFVTRSEVYAFPNSEAGQDVLFAGLLRSMDGGRRWATVRIRGGSVSGGLAFADPDRGVVSGFTRRCVGALWRTVDAGRRWTRVACERYLVDAVSFVTGRVAFAAGGGFAKYQTKPQLAVLQTRDGGRRWSSVFARGGGAPTGRPTGPFAAVQFTSLKQGYALVGGCTEGANGPCPGDLWVSHTGGRSWRDTGIIATQLAIAAPGDVWLVDSGHVGSSGQALWHSLNAGARFTAVANRSSLSIGSLVASGQVLFAHTDAGDYESFDTGERWRAVNDPALAVEEQRGESPTVVEASGLTIVPIDASRVWVSRNSGRTGRFAQPPGFGRQAIVSAAFADPTHGLALATDAAGSIPTTMCTGGPGMSVLATTNAGRRWYRLDTLPLYQPLLGTNMLAADSSSAIAIGSDCISRSLIAISHDHGRTWTLTAIHGLLSYQPATAANTIALWCLPFPNPTPTTAPRPLLLVTRNSGQAWTEYTLPTDIAGVAATPGRLWLYGNTATLWTSTNDGHSWHAEIPAFPTTS